MEVARNLPSTVLLGTAGVVEVFSNLSSTVLLGTLSLQEMLKIMLRRRIWNESISLLFRVERRVQKSLTRISTQYAGLVIWALMCSVSLLYAQTISVSLERVVEAFPMLPLDSVSRERLSDNAESRYTDAWAVSGSCSAILMDISHSTS